MRGCGFSRLLCLPALGGDLAALYRAVADGRNCMVFGLGKRHRYHVASYLDKFTLYVARDSVDARNIAEALGDFFGEQVCVLTGAEDPLIYRKAVGLKGEAECVRALYALAAGEARCCVATLQALTQYYPEPERLTAGAVVLERGKDCDFYGLQQQLAAAGYRREDVAEERGTFSVAGDIVTIFPAEAELPLRVSFFGDTVETIKAFQPDSRVTVAEKQRVVLLPGNSLLYTEEELSAAIAAASREADKLGGNAQQRAREIIGELAACDACAPAHRWLTPFLTDKMSGIEAYLPEHFAVIWDEPEVLSDKAGLYEKEIASRVKTLSGDGDALKAHARAARRFNDVKEALARGVFVGFGNITSSNAIFRPQEVFNIRTSNLGAYTASYGALLEDLRHFINGGFTTVVCMGDEPLARSFAQGLLNDDVACAYEQDVAGRRHGVAVTPIDLAHGFVYPTAKLAVIGRRDVVRSRAAAEKRDKNLVFTMPKVGDYVVHEVHGIGRCLGTKRVRTGETEQDYVLVEYRGGDLLYVPVDQMGRLTRFSGSDNAPRLSAIGGKEFERIKESVRRSVRAMAINLVDLYRERQNKKGYKYPPDTYWQKEFEDAFEFEETPDQLEAIRDVKSDMERGVIMDRLLCGDVGYGKTEVALRAVFKTIMENKQAVILAPTTILARQHCNTLNARFNPFKIRAELLTRFQTPAEIRASLARLEAGTSPVAVATHRILSKDVRFKDLGLVVLDEEQRFGVEHKEFLKTVRNNVNVLSMSATPIPRTLNMAMTGIRDISVLETPPKSRIPVQTTVTELTDGLLQDALGREMARGGQSFVLFNRVTGIRAFAERVRKLLPEARVVVGHGQMNRETLEETVTRFYNKEADVLVCTTIIENGIDIPDANTLIVCDADRLGLAQLYQLRGRVGRSDRVAYAYFTTEEGRVLTGDAAKRLSAVMDYTELGSGFKIAMRDLEIRGAGNILGREQHGHIEKVGYDMYCKLLKESVDELRGYASEASEDVTVSAAVDAYLDADYVPDENVRLRIYREIAELRTEKQRADFVDNVRQSFGEPPLAFVNLTDIALMKNWAAAAGVRKITVKDKGASLEFADASRIREESVFTAIADLGDDGVLTCDAAPVLVFRCKYLLNVQKLRVLKEFLRKSAKSFD